MSDGRGSTRRSCRATMLSAVAAIACCVAVLPAIANEGEGPATGAHAPLGKWGSLGPVYDLAVRLAADERYQDVIRLLTALKREDDPRVLNYLGYAHRKEGRAEQAVGYYERALTIEPAYTAARQYLGEAWLQLGQPDKAQLQLAEIEALCGKSCKDYRDLARAIANHARGESSSAGW